jgi:hypothetical protein
MTSALGMLVVVGLGCATQKAATPPPAGEEPGRAPDAVPPEKMEEIQSLLKRKSDDVGHCWSEEATRSGNRQLTVDMMIKLTIQPSGKPTDVQVIKDSIHSQEFERCVTGMVATFEFPQLPAPVEMTWPYSFKPLY